MTVCYFGIYDPVFGRNRVYRKGLTENGHAVLDCLDRSRGIAKFWRLWRKHRALPPYDVMVVGYPGHLIVPFAKLIARGPVVADLLGSLEDAETLSHGAGFWRRVKSALIDRLAVSFADIVLLESEAQESFFEKKFGSSGKYRVLYTGADDSVFRCDSERIEERFVVLFRGRLTPESGILHVLEAARLLKNDPLITFRIVGAGPLLSRARETITKANLMNVELITERLSEERLRALMCEAALSLGQLSDNPRLSRTIPHKAFESFALGIPYLSGDTPAIREAVRDGETGFLVPSVSPEALAKKIQELRANPALLRRVGEAANTEFTSRFSPGALADALLSMLRKN